MSNAFKLEMQHCDPNSVHFGDAYNLDIGSEMVESPIHADSVARVEFNGAAVTVFSLLDTGAVTDCCWLSTLRKINLISNLTNLMAEYLMQPIVKLWFHWVPFI